MFTRSVKFYTFHYHILKSTDVWRWFMKYADSKNEWLVLSASFTIIFELVFVLTLENAFPERFHFKTSRKSTGSSKNGIALRLRDPHAFVTISWNFKRFQYFNFETNSLENEDLFQRTRVPLFSRKKVLRLETHLFHTKLSCQKPLLRQMEWWVQNGSITKNGVLGAI